MGEAMEYASERVSPKGQSRSEDNVCEGKCTSRNQGAGPEDVRAVKRPKRRNAGRLNAKIVSRRLL